MNNSYKLKAPFDFSFLSKYGKVFKALDEQGSGNISFGVQNGAKRHFVKFAGSPMPNYIANRDSGAIDAAKAIEFLKAAVPLYKSLFNIFTKLRECDIVRENEEAGREMRENYPSDITREQFSVIRQTLLSAKKETHPREIDIYDIFCAVLYRLREGCRWRSLPHDFPKWQICYYHYNVWRHANDGEESVLDRVMRELVEKERIIDDRDPQTTMIIVDSKSVKNTDTAEEKGFDAGKKLLA